MYVYTHVLLFHLADMIPELASLVPDAASLLNNKDDPLFMFVEMGDVGWVVFICPNTLCFTRAQGVPLYNAGLKAVHEVGVVFLEVGGMWSLLGCMLQLLLADVCWSHVAAVGG